MLSKIPLLLLSLSSLLLLLLVPGCSSFLTGGSGYALHFYGQGEFAMFSNFSTGEHSSSSSFTFELWMRSFSWQTVFTPFSYSLPYDPMSISWQGLSHVHLFGLQVPLSPVSYQTIYGTKPISSSFPPPSTLNTTEVTPDVYTKQRAVMGDWYNNTSSPLVPEVSPAPGGTGGDGAGEDQVEVPLSGEGYPPPPLMWTMYQNVTENQLALWHHYAIVWNAGHFLMYLDGSPWVAAYFPIAANFTFNDGGILVLGQLQSNFGESFSKKSSFVGTMDEIRIWTSAQSQEAIQQNMHLSFGVFYGNNTPPENLVSCWSFDNTFFTAINDVYPYEVYDGLRRNVGQLGIQKESLGSTQVLLGPAVVDLVVIGVSQADVIAEDVPTVFIFSTITTMKVTFPWLPQTEDENAKNIVASILSSSLPSFIDVYKQAKNGTSLITTTEDGTNVGTYVIFETIPLLTTPEKFPFSLLYTLYDNKTGITRNGTFLLQYNLAPTAQIYNMDAFEGMDMLVGLLCVDLNGDNLTTSIVNPLPGILYQVEAYEPFLGFRYRTDPITPSANVVTHPSNIVVFSPLPYMQHATVSYLCSDEYSMSLPGTISLWVNPVTPPSLSGSSLWALDFNGLDSFASFVMQVNTSVLLEPTFSILFWVNIRHMLNYTEQYIIPKVNPDRNQTLVSLVDNSRSLSVEVSRTKGEYRLRLVQTSGDNNTEEVLDTPYFVVPDLWHHVAVAVDNSVPSATFFVDGVLLLDLKMSVPFLLMRTIFVGASPDQNPDNYFNGQLDELKIWNQLFTQADYSQEIATKEVPVEGDPLIFYWDFNEGSGKNSSVDLKNHSLLLLGGGNLLAFPKWVPSGVPNFVQWTTNENTPLVIYLDQTRTKIPGVVFITQLPTNGTLYQFQDNRTVISSPFSPFVSSIPISQWVSGIQNYSSYDSVYIPQNLIGPPSLYNPVYPFYGDSPLTWSPRLMCNIENQEFVEVFFEKEIFPMSVEVYESYNPGATDKILAWNKRTQSWVVLYQDNIPRLVAPQYNIFGPPLCEPIFKTNLYRIQFNTCHVDGWTQIDAIRVIGSEVPRNGMITDPQNRILYFPSPNNSGSLLDTLGYGASTCANSPMESQPTTFYLTVLANGIEETHDMVVQGVENQDIVILFQLGKVSEVLILSGPLHGTLYEVLANNQIGDKIDTDSVSKQLKLLYRPNLDDCGNNFDSFRYAASDGTTKSNGSTVVINISCAPGAHIYSVELIFMVSIVSSACILLCFGLLAWVFKERNHKFMWTNDQVFFYLLLGGNILCYISVYFYVVIMNVALCALRMWFTTIGYMIINGCHYARVYAMWRMFCNKVFKRENISQNNLMLLFGIFCGGQIVLLILFTLISPPHIIQKTDPNNPELTHVICSYSLPFVWAIIIYEFLMLCVTCFFCFILSKLDLQVVGSVAMYTLLAFSLACLPIFFLLDPVQMETQWIFPFFNIGTLTIPLLLIFIPKIIALQSANEGAKLVQIGQSVLNMNDYDPSPSANRKTAVEMVNRNPVPKAGDTDPTGEKSPQQMQEEIQQQLETIMTLENKLLKRKGQIKALEKKLQDLEG